MATSAVHCAREGVKRSSEEASDAKGYEALECARALVGRSFPALFARVVTSVTALAEGYSLGCISGVAVLLREDLKFTSKQVGVLLGIMSSSDICAKVGFSFMRASARVHPGAHVYRQGRLNEVPVSIPLVRFLAVPEVLVEVTAPLSGSMATSAVHSARKGVERASEEASDAKDYEAGEGTHALVGSSFPALCARVVTSVTALAEGYDIGSISGVAVLLREDLKFTSKQVGVLLGIMNYAVMCGAPLGGWMADALGRKKALALTYVMLIVGALTMVTAQNFMHAFLGCVVTGMGVGVGLSVVTSYITEVSPKRYRGTLVGLQEFFFIIGIACGYVLNYALDIPGYGWRYMVGIGAITPMGAMLMLLLPHFLESPRWTMLRGQLAQAEADLRLLVGHDEAREMLQEWGRPVPLCTWAEVLSPKGTWGHHSDGRDADAAPPAFFGVASLAMLRGQLAQAEADLRLLVGHDEAREMLQEWGRPVPLCTWAEVLSPKGTWRRQSLRVAVFIMALSLTGGIGTTTVYMGTIFATDVNLHEAAKMTSIVGGMRIVVQTVSSFVLVDLWGRRPLMLVTLAGATLALGATAFAYGAQAAMMPYKFLPFLAFNLVHSFGLAPVAWIYPAEIMPSDLRSKGVSLGTMVGRGLCGAINIMFPVAMDAIGLAGIFACFAAVGRGLSGTINIMFPVAMDAIGLAGIFACFAAVNSVGLAFVFLCAPESKGHSLEEMHALFPSGEEQQEDGDKHNA
eukprot:CAMPEP_0183483984 /NCGR_PEP_ID=MMETSP0370-20130417/178691_1 /TAXON_ID=268820 /ORGANISM="Peridinium aciculiferum, Strain PAER-2" /LENGTH=742 /DNA_ID=CAMNT_0025677269 /DNA_START=102 /DNA_END=2332 /DNA_ORIENTATION=-